MKSYGEITYRYLKLQKKRSILTVVGIILSVALLSAIFTMMVSLREKMIRDAIKDNGDYHGKFVSVSGDKVNRIANNVEVLEYGVAEKVGTAIISKVNEKEREANPERAANNFLIVSGYDNEAFKARGVNIKEGRLPQSDNELLVDISSLDNFENKPKIGDKIKLELGIRIDKKTGKEMPDNSWSSDDIFEKKSEKEFTIVGITNSRFMHGFGNFYYAATYMDSGFLKDNSNYNMYVKLKSTKSAHEKLENIASNAGLPIINNNGKGIFKYNIEVNEQLLRLYAQSISPSSNEGVVLTLVFIIVLIIICTIAVIYNAFHISVLERISQFGILRCTGASPAQIRNIVFREAGILSLIGIPIGLFSGIFAMKIVMSIIGSFKYNYFEGVQIIISPYVFVLGTLLGAATVFLSAFGPARQAGKVSALEAVRNTGSFKKEKIKKLKKSKLSKLLFGIEGEIAYKNLRRNRKRFRITVFSMVISIVLYIVFASFVDFIFKMDVISAGKEPDFTLYKSSGKKQDIEDSIYGEIKSLPGVDRVFKNMKMNYRMLASADMLNPKLSEIKYANQPEKVEDSYLFYNNMLSAYGDDNLEVFKELLRQGIIDKEAMDKENGVILIKAGKFQSGEYDNGVILDVINAKVGDKLKLIYYTEETSDKPEKVREYTKKDFKYKEVKVMAIAEKGIFSEEYNYNGGVNFVTTEKVFKEITGSMDNNAVDITLKNDANKDPVANYLKELKEKDSTYGYNDFAEIAKENKQFFISISIFLYGFIGVITLIGCLNIINTISTNLILRTRELSMLRAVGMAKGAIEKMICLEGVFYGILAAIYGGTIGSVLSYMLFRFMMNVRGFEFMLPFKHIIIAVIGAMMVALISGLIPLRKINKGSIIDHIRMEE
jgi:putative ABC transport system permease protein